MLGLLTLLVAAAGAPHPAPAAYLQVEVEEGRVQLELVGEQKTLLPWLGVEGAFAQPLAPADAERLMAAGDAMFRSAHRITVDGERAYPTAETVDVPEPDDVRFGGPALRVVFAAGCEGLPRSVGVVWERFDGLDGSQEGLLPTLFKAQGMYDTANLTEEEPEFVWYPVTEDLVPRVRPTPVVSAAPATWSLPLVSIGFGLFGLVASVIALVRRGKLAATCALAGTIVGAGLATDFRSEVPALWTPPVSLPAEAQALEIFEALHANVYAAFAENSEDEIYALLAVSVAPELLDELYVDVYESLILRTEGGAVCQVEGIDVDDREVVLPEPGEADGELAFDVLWSWRVHGVVTHWGHQHRRTNRYRARYTVRHDGVSWKIAAVETLEHERVVDPEQAAIEAGFGPPQPPELRDR